MIPSRSEVLTSLWGAYRLARFDAAGATVLGDSPGAAMRSFFAAIILLPLYLLSLVLHGLDTPSTSSIPFAMLGEMLVYAIGWMIFPVLAWHVADVLGKTDRYPHFVCAYNWASALQNALFLALDALVTMAGSPNGAGAFLGIVAMAYILGYGWFVARTTLDLTAGTAALVVAFDLLSSTVWNGFATRLLGG